MVEKKKNPHYSTVHVIMKIKPSCKGNTSALRIPILPWAFSIKTAAKRW